MSFDFVSAKEAAVEIGVTERWIQQLCKDGKVDGAMQFGARGIWLVPKKWIEQKNKEATDIEKI